MVGTKLHQLHCSPPIIPQAHPARTSLPGHFEAESQPLVSRSARLPLHLVLAVVKPNHVTPPPSSAPPATLETASGEKGTSAAANF